LAGESKVAVYALPIVEQILLKHYANLLAQIARVRREMASIKEYAAAVRREHPGQEPQEQGFVLRRQACDSCDNLARSARFTDGLSGKFGKRYHFSFAFLE
jgi:hypothetical protein